ncbi:MAG: Uma2 family endonuclease [Isosphaeraceae bacterium]|nr:Uma2 family endonuclease [Isosphaeraceae bacterium]
MSTPIALASAPDHEADVVYPDSDGLPMAENTLQFQWITTIVGGLEALYRDNPNVFVAGDLLWYPIEGDNKTRIGPDALVVFGRPKGHRGSYMQWKEGGIAPQVVFEVLSPGNRPLEMMRKYNFYERFDVEEYYVYDPDNIELSGWRRTGAIFDEIAEMDGWVSPRLGIRFDLSGPELKIIGPDARPFATYVELAALAQEADARASEADARAARLAAQLRAMGIEPEA